MLETLDCFLSLFTQVTRVEFPTSRHKKHHVDLGQLCECAKCCSHLPHEHKLWAASCLYESMYDKANVLALQLLSPKTRDLTLDKHPLVKERPLVALKKSDLPQTTH